MILRTAPASCESCTKWFDLPCEQGFTLSKCEECKRYRTECRVSCLTVTLVLAGLMVIGLLLAKGVS